MKTIAELDERLSRPSSGLIKDFQSLHGDLLVLGAGGKMGPTLSIMARRALPAAQRVIAVSLFGADRVQQNLEAHGVETISGDLLDEAFLKQLPDIANIVYMAGLKFGSTENPAETWAMNVLLPAKVAHRFPNSRIVAFSTGNVYPFVPVASGGCVESDPPGPVGEYAQSCLGRERMFQYYSLKNRTAVTLFRLNYASELRYGVIVDVATRVFKQEAIDLTMGHFNVIWQGDANNMALRSLLLADVPPRLLNVTGPEIVSIRWLAEQFAALFGVQPVFTGTESETALLSNPAAAIAHFGEPEVSVKQMIPWVADWLKQGGALLNKPTHFEERGGKY
ncbi:MAG TPA: NAD-dependent epimerase/dehydratase family protein [bacterium]|nr:NAD-dependent epimerase/dehydratase family protein [bacterium]HPN34694.1 NAD-dependent epimerase/dehydratase family protein [bacterium]